MAAALDHLLVLWKEWGIQMLVLLSLALQVTLIITAEIRQRKDSGVLRIIVWSAYMMADTTATYTLGHMSVTTRSPEHELVAFWAPFLLLHLGGQDNITAYSTEDNRLWQRHLQSFVVQVFAVAYVLNESSIFSGGSRSMLRKATILMFVVGVVKYAERVWALKKASSSTLSGNNYRSFGEVIIDRDRWYQTRKIKLLGSRLALLLLNFPKHVLKGPLPLVTVDWIVDGDWKQMYHVAEIQLSLMYGVFYSKAELIHTWYGYCIRLTSLTATVTALWQFVLFSGKDGYNRVDVAASYVLLAGAVVLEITSALRAMFSTWTQMHIITFVNCGDETLTYLVYRLFKSGQAVRSAMRRVGMPKSRYWSGSMGQHNFLYMCGHCKVSRSSKIARWMGREDWWNTLVYTSSSVPVSADFSPLLKEQLRGSMGIEKENPDHIQNSRGRAVLKKRGLYEELSWSVDTDMEESILIWHIATHVYLSWYEEEHRSLPHLAKVTQELSNYMMFLLASRPYLLPDNATRQRYIELCKKVIHHLKYSSPEDLLRLIRNHGDVLSAGQPQTVSKAHIMDCDTGKIVENETFDRASQLGTKLICKELETPNANILGLISQVWVEMLCYAGYRCSPDSHAMQLSNGGEIITIAALMVEYTKSGVLRFGL